MQDNNVREYEHTAPHVSEKLLEDLAQVVGMAEVEILLKEKFRSETQVMTEIPEYLLSLGGKRLRPILTLRCGELFSPPSDFSKLVTIAAGIELIHMATLLHDDIVDNSPTRRHQPSPFAKYGMPKTLISGDFLLVRAFSLCSRLDRAIVDATEDACIALTEGETEEFAIPLAEHTAESTIRIARKKTAALFRLGAFSAAYLAHAPENVQKELGIFGESLGVAFQILDDILDVTSTSSVLGKQAGMDIRERKPSLVNVLWLASGDSFAADLLLGDSVPSDEQIATAIAAIKDGAVLGETRNYAKSYADRASAALNAAVAAGTSSATTIKVAGSLQSLIDFTLSRMR